MSELLKDRIALVTGASRGIGAAVAKTLAAQGAHVILVARTVGALEEVDDAIQAMGGTATIAPLDLREHDLIDQLAATIYKRWGKLDILVGNAAMMGILGPLAHQSPKQVNDIISLNITANFRLIRAMSPLLEQSDAARALFITDEQATQNTPYWGSYAASKAAMQAMVQCYAAEQINNSIRVNLYDPGIVATAMRAKAFPGENPSKHKSPEAICDDIVRMLCPDYQEQGIIGRAS